MARPDRYWAFFALSLLRVGAVTGLASSTTSTPPFGDYILQGLQSSQNTSTSASAVGTSSSTFTNTSRSADLPVGASQTSTESSSSLFATTRSDTSTASQRDTTTSSSLSSSTTIATSDHDASSQSSRSHTSPTYTSLASTDSSNRTSSTSRHRSSTTSDDDDALPGMTATTTSWATTVQPSLMSHAQSCWSVWSTYKATQASCTDDENTAKCVTKTIYRSSTLQTSSTFYPNASVSTYSLCDGFARAEYNPVTTTITQTSTDAWDNAYPSGKPEPEVCFPDYNDCAIYYWGSNLPHISEDVLDPAWLYAACGNPPSQNAGCHIQGNRARVLYFPVQTQGGDLCHPSNRTITPSPTVVTTLGTTFTQGSVYLSLDTLFAGYLEHNDYGHEAVTVGPNFENIILPFATSDMSTNCYHDPRYITGSGYGPGTQINFADWNAPFPASAYWCQNQCVIQENIGGTLVSHTPKQCSTIWDDFHPLVALPTAIKGMASEWESCNLFNTRVPNFVFDPPTALQVQTAAAQLTAPAQAVTTTEAKPSATVAPQSGPTAIADSTPTSKAQTSASQSQISSPQETVSHSQQSESQAADPPASASVSAPQAGAPPASNSQSRSPQESASQVSVAPTSNSQPQASHSSSQQAPQFTFNPASSTVSAGPVIESSASQGLQGPTQPAGSSQTPSAVAPVSQSSTAAGSLQTASEAGPVSVSFTPAASTAQVFTLGQATFTKPAQSTAAQQAAVPIGSMVVQATLLGSTAVVIGGSTVPVGSSATIAGAVVVAQSGGVVVQSQAASASSPQVQEVAHVTAADGSVVSATILQGNVGVVAGSTLSAGGPALTVSGQVLSMASNGNLMAGGTTLAATPAAHTPVIGGQAATEIFSPNSSPIQTLDVGGQALTASFASGSSIAVINGQTLSIGGTAITAAGQTISLASAGLIADGTPIPAQSASAGETFHVSGQIVTASYLSGSNAAVVGSRTLSAGGPAATLDGEVVSMASTGLVGAGSTRAANSTRSAGSSTAPATTANGGSRSSVGSSRATTATTTTHTGAASSILVGRNLLTALMVILPLAVMM